MPRQSASPALLCHLREEQALWLWGKYGQCGQRECFLQGLTVSQALFLHQPAWAHTEAMVESLLRKVEILVLHPDASCGLLGQVFSFSGPQFLSL